VPAGILSVLSSLLGKSLKKVETRLKSGKCFCRMPSKTAEKQPEMAVFVSFLLEFAPIYRETFFGRPSKAKQKRKSVP